MSCLHTLYTFTCMRSLSKHAYCDMCTCTSHNNVPLRYIVYYLHLHVAGWLRGGDLMFFSIWIRDRVQLCPLPLLFVSPLSSFSWGMMKLDCSLKQHLDQQILVDTKHGNTIWHKYGTQLWTSKAACRYRAIDSLYIPLHGHVFTEHDDMMMKQWIQWIL